MSRRVRVGGVEALEAVGGVMWERDNGLERYERGNYSTRRSGVPYQLEKRTWSPGEPDDTGWYLYSYGVVGGFFGVWCAKALTNAVDVATEMILKRDLSIEKDGYGK